LNQAFDKEKIHQIKIIHDQISQGRPKGKKHYEDRSD